MVNVNTSRRWYYYPLAHWRGEQGFAWSFWVNLVALRLVIFIAQRYLDPGVGRDYTDIAVEFLSLAMFAHVVILIWQIGGVLRAGERFISAGGSMAEVWGSYLGILIAFWLSLSYVLEAQQWTKAYPRKNWQVETIDPFEITLDKSRKIARISGEIGPGLTKKFKFFLDKHDQIQTITLNSIGGNIYEARGVAKLIRENGFSTHVENVCLSSCTIIFIGGKKRSVENKGRLGFHQYRIAAKYQVGFADIKLEQTRDRTLFLKAGVNEAFVAKMFALNANEMWYPDHLLLRKSGVTTTVKYNKLKSKSQA